MVASKKKQTVYLKTLSKLRLTPSLLAQFFLGFKHLQNTTLRIKFLTNKLGLSCAKLSYGSYLEKDHFGGFFAPF